MANSSGCFSGGITSSAAWAARRKRAPCTPARGTSMEPTLPAIGCPGAPCCWWPSAISAGRVAGDGMQKHALDWPGLQSSFCFFPACASNGRTIFCRPVRGPPWSWDVPRNTGGARSRHPSLLVGGGAAVVLGTLVGWAVYIEHVLPKQELEREQRTFAAAVRREVPAAAAGAVLPGRGPRPGIPPWQAPQYLPGMGKSRHLGGTAGLPLHPDAGALRRRVAAHVTSGRLEEVLRNTPSARPASTAAGPDADPPASHRMIVWTLQRFSEALPNGDFFHGRAGTAAATPIATAPLSILLTVRDAESSLKESLAAWETCLARLGRDYEILLVDDGTASHAEQPRLRVLRPVGPPGVGTALRAGLAAVTEPPPGLCQLRPGLPAGNPGPVPGEN